MPMKRSHRKVIKKFAKKHVRRQQKIGQHYIANSNAITYIGSKFRFLPDRYRTRLDLNFTGQWATGVGSQVGYFGILLNSLHQPLNVNPVNGATNPVPLNTVPTTAYPVGYTTLTSYYQGYRVFSSSIKVTIVPQSIVDTIEVCIIPQSHASYTKLSGPPTSIANSMQQPFNKHMMCQANRLGSVKNSISQYKLEGLRKDAIENDLSNNYAVNALGTLVALPSSWTCMYATPDAAVLANPIVYQCDISWFVEFYSPYTANLNS